MKVASLLFVSPLEIYACGVNASVSKEVRKLNYVLIILEEHLCKEVSERVGVEFFFVNLARLCKRLQHFAHAARCHHVSISGFAQVAAFIALRHILPDLVLKTFAEEKSAIFIPLAPQDYFAIYDVFYFELQEFGDSGPRCGHCHNH